MNLRGIHNTPERARSFFTKLSQVSQSFQTVKSHHIVWDIPNSLLEKSLRKLARIIRKKRIKIRTIYFNSIPRIIDYSYSKILIEKILNFCKIFNVKFIVKYQTQKHGNFLLYFDTKYIYSRSLKPCLTIQETGETIVKNNMMICIYKFLPENIKDISQCRVLIEKDGVKHKKERKYLCIEFIHENDDVELYEKFWIFMSNFHVPENLSLYDFRRWKISKTL